MSGTCGARMVAMFNPDHTHVCSGSHDAGDHLCADPKCRRYFWAKEKPKKKVVKVKVRRGVV